VPDRGQENIIGTIARGVALTVSIFVVSIHIPVFGFFFSLFIPLPALYARMKLGRHTGGAVPVISAIIIAAWLGARSFDTAFFAELLLLGFMLGEMFERNLSVEKTVGYASGIVLGAGLVILILYGNFSSGGSGNLVSEYVENNLAMTLTLYEQVGVSEENIRIISESLDKIQYVLVRIIPGLAVAFTLFITWTTLLMAKPILKSRNLPFPEFRTLNHWKVPESLVWGVIGCGLMLLFPDKAIKLVGINGLIIMMTIYFFGGIAIVSFYFDKKRFPLFLRFFLYSLIVLQQIVLFIVIGLGFFDMWLNLRKLETHNNHE
jgi:uncharacterized protein YybS (DUF2232 family)